MEVSKECGNLEFLNAHFEYQQDILNSIPKADTPASLVKILWVGTNNRGEIRAIEPRKIKPLDNGKLCIEFFSRILGVLPTSIKEQETLYELQDSASSFLEDNFVGILDNGPILKYFLDTNEEYKALKSRRSPSNPKKPFSLLSIIKKNNIKQGVNLPAFSYCKESPPRWTDSTQCKVKKTSILLSSILPIPSTSSALEKGTLSLKEFTDLILQCRGVEIRPPISSESSVEDYLMHELLSGTISSETRDNRPDYIDKLLKNKGVARIQGDEYRLYHLRHISQKDLTPCGAIILRFKKATDEKQASIEIESLGIRKDFQRKNFSTLLLAYAVKIAQEHDISLIELTSSNEGKVPYIRFGFAPTAMTLEEWQKISEKVRHEEPESIASYDFVLRPDLPEVKEIMKDQLFRALRDNSHPFYQDHKVEAENDQSITLECRPC